jgi:hypothetical protein
VWIKTEMQVKERVEKERMHQVETDALMLATDCADCTDERRLNSRAVQDLKIKTQ